MRTFLSTHSRVRFGLDSRGTTPSTALLWITLLGLFTLALGILGGYFSSVLVGWLLILIGVVSAAAISLVAWAIIRSLIFAASEIVFAPPPSDKQIAYQFLYDFLMNRLSPSLWIQEGQILDNQDGTPTKRIGMRGPANLKIDHASVVLMEKGGKRYLLGMGSHFIESNDYVRGIVDLYWHRKALSLGNVYTKDNIPLSINLTIYYRIQQSFDYTLRRGVYAPRQEAVISAVMNNLDWKELTEVTARGALRDFFARYTLNDIHGTYPRLIPVDGTTVSSNPSGTESPLRVGMEEKIRDDLTRAVWKWGAEVVAVSVDEILLPEAVQKTLREAWAAAWQHKVEHDKADVGARIKKREAEGTRDATEIERVAKMIRAVGEAESNNILARARAERERTVAEAQADAQRVLASSRAEVSVEFLRRVEQLFGESKMPNDPASIREYFALLRMVFLESEGERRKKKGGKEEQADEMEESSDQKRNNGKEE